MQSHNNYTKIRYRFGSKNNERIRGVHIHCRNNTQNLPIIEQPRVSLVKFDDKRWFFIQHGIVL